jgi:hypothetical protein
MLAAVRFTNATSVSGFALVQDYREGAKKCGIRLLGFLLRVFAPSR